ncbi:MAG: 1-acyl-sn-glycerol-3-phosphate acyltransferase [Halioglobus sp.]|jgi:1-acyl-sn-glycerol-3-phosphate acyltransferase
MAKRQTNKAQATDPALLQEIIDASLAIDEEKKTALLDRMYGVVKIFANPTVLGAENIPAGPVLYIGNHSTMAFDVLVAAPALQRASGRFVRGMSDEIMYRSPKIREFVISAGAVIGHAAVGDALFKAGKDLLLFPGGAYEANKNLDERYTIKWKQRTGFVRMAAKHGVPIVPVGIVGPDEWFGRYMDRDEVAQSWIAGVLKLAGASDEFLESDQMPPIPRGMFGTLIPRPQRAYVSIGEPISTAAYKGKKVSKKVQEDIRDLTRERLEASIAQMLLLQAQDRDTVSVLRRFLSFY